MDKHLDNSVTDSHAFLKGRAKLEALKIENPCLRLSTASNVLKESITANERTTQGLKAPEKAFMELSVYIKRHGQPRPEDVKTVHFKGKDIVGVDVQKEEDAAQHSLLCDLCAFLCAIFQ